MRLRNTQLPTREEWLPGDFGPTRIVKWKRKEYALSAGTSDTVEFWRDLDAPGELYVLTYNNSFGYMGLELLNSTHDHEHEDEPTIQTHCKDAFIQDADNLVIWNGNSGRSINSFYAPNAIRVLVEYLG